MTDLSLNETARRHGVSKAGLSQAVHADRPIKGMALHRFAVMEDGEVRGFEFPDWYSIPDESDGEEEETVFMTMEELCQEHSAFHRWKIEEALRHGWPVDGFPVYDWVCYDDLGEWDGFEVPKSADFDGPQRQDMPTSDVPAPESGENIAAQGGSPNEIALSGDHELSDEHEDENEADGGSKAAQGLLALGGAIAFSALMSQ